ncbi:Zinc finger protein [Trichinella pseudospiralis]|uniref:Zinc finger protein n=1 Tax=Trichinella pseudospiralis TaxID=6337 RepID=A0A0V1JAP9_TRIPS|nr:Zinc finger protein [Trichinella pseudospiralis]KRZ46028.1 Zinc finger protein [Trichinella pseudospiralis]
MARCGGAGRPCPFCEEHYFKVPLNFVAFFWKDYWNKHEMSDWNSSVVAEIRDDESSVMAVSNGHANPVRGDDSALQCSECGYELQDASSLWNHFRPGYFFKKEYCCRICLAVFASSCAWSAHARVHDNTGPFVCPECGQELGSAEKRGRHLLIHYADRCDTPAWICPVCLKYYNDRSLLLVHLIHVHVEKLYCCQPCARLLHAISAFDRHCQQKHGRERAAQPVLYYSCGIVNCSWKTSAREDLKLHFEEHVKQKVHLTRCCSCGWLFQTEQDLVSHQRSFHKIVPIDEIEDDTFPLCKKPKFDEQFYFQSYQQEQQQQQQQQHKLKLQQLKQQHSASSSSGCSSASSSMSAVLRCECCGEVESEQRQMLLHGQRHRQAGSAVCLLCRNLEFDNELALREHIDHHVLVAACDAGPASRLNDCRRLLRLLHFLT